MNLSFHITEPKLWGLTKTDMGNAGRSAIEAAGKLWHSLFKGRHFQKEAFEIYHYHPRARAYEAEKLRRRPQSGGRPLVFSGESERSAMASNKVKATKSDFAHYHADIIVDAPALNYRQLYDEMTRTTDEEDAALRAYFCEIYAGWLVRAAEENGASSRQINLLSGHLSAA